MRLTTLILLTILTPGCTTYTTAQLRLTDQARKGIAIWAAREFTRDAEIHETYAAKRRSLDSAFDADVRAHSDQFDPAWVIESRRAYAAGLTLLNQSETSALATSEAARRDAAATEEALAKLAWLLRIQSDAGSIFSNLLNSSAKGGPR